MSVRKSRFWILLVLTLVALGATVSAWGRIPPALGAGERTEAPQSGSTGPDTAAETAAAGDPLILSYAAKFVCLEPLQPGQVSYSTVAPIVQENTDVAIHNPNDFTVTFYKKAVRAPLENLPPIEPGNWKRVNLRPDHAVRADCDDIAKLLTGNPSATFIGTFGIGVKVEGFVVIGVGLQTVATRARYSPLDVTATYNKSSEVLKKDISYQPWWWWWWWRLPWRLGYPHQRILPIDPTSNIDCRGLLYDALARDARADISDPTQLQHTLAALDEGRKIDPTTVGRLAGASDPPALVALLGRCDKIDANTASVDYVLLSNKGSTDPDPRPPTVNRPLQIRYPWIPGRWHDLTVVMPQNITVDLDDYMRQWHTQRWIDAGENADTVKAAMVYYFPWWCGWGYWWWWWQGNDCIDIGVGEGESIDVEQITPVRVFVNQWPPSP